MNHARLAFVGVKQTKDGQAYVELSEREKASYRAGVAKFKDGTPIKITLERQSAKHTDQARGYYFAVVVKLIAEHTGFTDEEQHEVLKALHLDKQAAIDGRNGHYFEPYVIGGSIAKLNKVEFYDYVERCRVWAAADLGVTTPDPDPEYWREKEDAA